MKRMLVVISTDPRTSPRPAEAIRIAAGVGAWKKAEVSLLLRGPAGYCLAEEVDDFKDEDNFTRYLPIIAEWKRPIYVESTFDDSEVLEYSPWKFEKVDEAQIAKFYLENDDFLHL